MPQQLTTDDAPTTDTTTMPDAFSVFVENAAEEQRSLLARLVGELVMAGPEMAAQVVEEVARAFDWAQVIFTRDDLLRAYKKVSYVAPDADEWNTFLQESGWADWTAWELYLAGLETMADLFEFDLLDEGDDEDDDWMSYLSELFDAAPPPDYASWTRDELRIECKFRGLKVHGLKAELVERLEQNDGIDEQES